MNSEHYKEKLSAYVHRELPDEQKHLIDEHLEACDECRSEYEEILFASQLASGLPKADASKSAWAAINDALDQQDSGQFGLIPQRSSFTFRNTFAFTTAAIVVALIGVGIYMVVLNDDFTYHASTQNQNSASTTVNSLTPNLNQLGNMNAETNSNSDTDIDQSAEQSVTDGWNLETLAGAPKIGDVAAGDKISVGQMLETDSGSRARISVADIGTVDVSPNSRVKFVATGKNEHRLSLERGKMHAKIFAPPRLFVVDTPSAKAVDLGCEYTLDVDKSGGSLLHVTGGFVALERNGRESIVPAGMMCRVRSGKGLGTPFSADATETFRNALDRFDFSGGSIEPVLADSDFYDMVTLWHLLSRVKKDERGAVFDTLAEHVKPPASVTRDGVIALDKEMLEAWRTEVENVWFN